MTIEQAQVFKAEGNKHFQEGNFEEALDSFTKAISEDQSNHVLYSNRSGTYVNLELFELAIADANQTIKLNPSWPKGYSRLGTALFKNGQFDEAEAAYEEGLKLDPENPALKDGLKSCQAPSGFPSGFPGGFPGGMPGMGGGMPGMGGGMPGMDIGSLLQDPEIADIMKEDPAVLIKVMQKMQTIQQNPAEALTLINDPDPQVRKIFMKMMGKMMGGMGGGMPDLAGMGGDMPDLAGMGGDMPDLAGMGGDTGPSYTQYENEAPAAARTTPKATATVVPDESTEKWVELKNAGNELYKNKEFERALEKYDEAFEASERKELILFSNKAAVYMEMKDLEKAQECVEDALEQRFSVKCSYETAAKLMVRMAVICERTGDLEGCVKWYEKSLVEDNVRKVRGELSKIKMKLAKKIKEDYLDDAKAEEARLAGNELFKGGKYPEALKSYDEGIKRNPNDARIYSNRAAAFLKLFDPPNALRSIDKALELDPKFVRAHCRKGEIHVKLKENHKALEAYQNGLKIDPNDHGCQEGARSVISKVQESSTNNEVDEEQRARAMADPEIQAILSDPQFQLLLKQAQEDPSVLQGAMQDVKFAAGFEKLIAAGILKVG